MEFQQVDKVSTITYGEVLSVSDIQTQYKIYQEVLQTAKPIILKAATVNVVDTASLQLLLCFLLTAKQQKISFKWQECSSVLARSIQILGLQYLSGLSE